MKTYLTIALAMGLAVGCSSQPSSKEAQPTAAAPSAPSKPEGPSPASPPPPPPAASGAAAELISCAMTPDKTNLAYKIKVTTDKPVDEVHLALKETDAGGKVLEETMVVWQNIVHSTRQPIENGKTYEDQSALIPDTAKVDCALKEVIFKDGSRWAK